VKADVYFHSGYYPSVFDQAQAPKDSHHMTSQEGSQTEEEHEKAMNFLRLPRIDRAFGRHFLVTEHTHLAGRNERAILPWLRLSAELDPRGRDLHRRRLLAAQYGQNRRSEQFLHEGRRANPDSPEILFELGNSITKAVEQLNGRGEVLFSLAAKDQRLLQQQHVRLFLPDSWPSLAPR